MKCCNCNKKASINMKYIYELSKQEYYKFFCNKCFRKEQEFILNIKQKELERKSLIFDIKNEIVIEKLKNEN